MVYGVLDEYVLIIENVSKIFGDRRVLDNITFRVRSGETYALLGPNGAGKTTLINIILGIIKPSSGRVLVKNSTPLNPKARGIIGFSPQDPSLVNRLTGIENIKLFTNIYGIRYRDVKDRVEELSEKLGLKSHLNKLVEKYSGGMRKKLSLLLALIHDPEILVLDEPTTGMDPVSRRIVWDILEDLKREGKTILLSTHYMEEADRLADRVSIMFRGKILVEGTPSDLKKKYGPRTVIELKTLWINLGDAVAKLRDLGLQASTSNELIKVFVEEAETSVPRIVSTIYSMGGVIEYLRVVKPTLEDVFIKLTGRRLGE